MALARNIMKGGWSAGNAKAVNGAVATGLTAAGTNLATALALQADTNVIGTAAASTGVSLPSAEIGDSCEVYNGGANTVTVYPDAAANQINAITAGSGFSLATNTACFCRKVSATRWIAFLSA
jgi:hypothetical protein